MVGKMIGRTLRDRGLHFAIHAGDASGIAQHALTFFLDHGVPRVIREALERFTRL